MHIILCKRAMFAYVLAVRKCFDKYFCLFFKSLRPIIQSPHSEKKWQMKEFICLQSAFLPLDRTKSYTLGL